MIRIWDPWVRLFHWTLAASVLSNVFLTESGGAWHDRLGYLGCGLIGWRIVWGIVGSPYSRFSEMRRSWPARGQLYSHVRIYLAGKYPRTLSHSPLAQVGMGSMLICVLALGLTGWMMSWDEFFGEQWLQTTHETLSNILLGLAVTHVLGVTRDSILHRENLVASMIHGKKRPL